METLVDLFQTFAGHGPNPALVYRTGVRRLGTTYGELADLSWRAAGLLQARGVGRGDRVILWGPNGPAWAVAFWGCVVRGAVVVPVDFLSGRERAATIAALTEAVLVIQSRAKAERLTGVAELFLEDLVAHLAGQAPLAEAAAVGPDDLAQLIYTSGTTGNPKGVMLSHRNLMANLTQVNAHLPVVTPTFTFLSLLPLSHMFEQMGGFFTPLSHGAPIVYLRTLKPSAILEALAEEEIAAVVAVPRLLQLLRGSIEHALAAKGLDGLFRSLLARADRLPRAARTWLFAPVHRRFGTRFRFFVSGGAPLSTELFTFWQRLGFTVIEGYGLTECAPVLAANTLELQQAGSVGRALPGVELRLQEGEILARGANVFAGYFRNDAATRDAFTPDGWFRTGDLGELDADGFLRIKGRAKELIVTGAGINVYPDELEEILNRLLGVREACIIGFDRGGGEEVHAVLLLDSSGRPAEAIIDEANGRLDELHRITGFSLWPEAEFPKTTTLKIQKFKVKERLRSVPENGARQGVADPLHALLARVIGCPLAQVSEGARLVADLGLTSIGRLELVNLLEQEYRLDLEDTLIGPTTTVGELRGILSRRERVESRQRFRRWSFSPPVVALRRLADQLLHRPLLNLYVSLDVQGLDKLTGVSGPVLFIANHTSYLDQPCVMNALPPAWRYRTATAAWAEFFFVNFRTPAQHLWKRLTYEYTTTFMGVFPLPQSTGFRRSLQHMGWLADHGISSLVFPEGERTQNGQLLPFQQGLGIIVRELGVPVVPVRIAGLERVLPRDARWPKRGRVTVTFGAPLLFPGTAAPEMIVSRCRQAISELPHG